MSLGQRCGAEFVGTFWLVFGGCGSAVLATGFPDAGIGLPRAALAGLVYGALGRKRATK